MNDISEFYENSPSIDGFLHIPEMNLFIPSSLMLEIDIQAIGGKQGHKSVPGHVPDLTTSGLHVWCGHGPAVPDVVLLSCWHSISGIVANSVPGHVLDLTTSGLHVWCGHGPAVPAVVLLSCWHSISAILANSVPGHVPDLTTSPLHTGHLLLLSLP